MPIKAKKLEQGVFTKEDEERMWEKFREVWIKEKVSEEVEK